MNDMDFGQAVRDVIAALEQKQATIGCLVQNLRIVCPAVGISVVEASAIESAPSHRQLLSAGKPGRKHGKRAGRPRKGLAGVDVEDLLARVKAQLRLGPCKVSALTSALRIDSRRAKLALNRLRRSGLAAAQGRSRGAQWSLTKQAAIGDFRNEHRTLAAAVEGQSKPTVSSAGTSRVGMESPAGADVVHARDAAILAKLRKGPATIDDLRKAIPKEADLDDQQHGRACSNALTRLRLKGQIKQTEDGWALAGG